MDDTLLTEQLRQSHERNETLQRELASLRASLEQVLQGQQTLRRDYEALVDATRTVTGERDALRQRVAELEAANRRLVDMLWGRRSERRIESADQGALNFGDEPVDPPSVQEQEIITAQTEADEARDQELLKRLEARRKARREKQQQGREEFPAALERRERVIDLPEDQKQGLQLIGVKVTERLRFEKPHVYVEVIKRPQYAVPGKPAEGVQSMPPPLAIVESCKYDFSVIATILAMKFAFHMPTYREQDWFAQCGWFPSRSTTNDLINYGVDTIGPLYQQMWSLLLAQPILLGDDTRLCVLLRGALDEEQLAQLGDRSRLPCGGAARRHRPSRFGHQLRLVVHEPGRPGPVQRFSLVADAPELGDRRTSGHLSRHLRGRCLRRQCAPAGAIGRTDRAFRLQCACPAGIRPGRVERSGPGVAGDFILRPVVRRRRTRQDPGCHGAWGTAAARGGGDLEPHAALVGRRRGETGFAPKRDRRSTGLPAEPLVGTDGVLGRRADPDRQRPVGADDSAADGGPRNWLFLGHPNAAAGRLQMYSIVSSAHRHHLVIADYLEDVLRRLADAQQNHPADLELGAPYLLELLPDRWALAHPKSVCHDRIEEREIVSDAKRGRRAKARIKARAAQAANAR